MKTIFTFLLCLFGATTLWAQDVSTADAVQLLSKNKQALSFTSDDIQNSIISNAFVNASAGTTMLYVQQSFKTLPVFNQVQSLAFKNGLLVSAAGERLRTLPKLVAAIPAVPTVPAETALRTTLTAKNIALRHPLIATSAGAKTDFGKAGISHERITAELMWVPLQDGASVRLAWQVYVAPTSSSDYWLVRVDAHNNEIIGETNLTTYCNFHLSEQHTTASHVATIGTPPTINSGTAASTTWGTNLVNSATYRVIPFPAESPNHAGGAPALRTNPWTLTPGNATSLNWHSNGSTDFAISRGNNVWAREDRRGTSTSDSATLPAFSTTSPDPLTFDFVPDFTVAPTQTSPVPNQAFNITNLFYWNNIIHDLTYQYGFDEVSGNFQQNNLGRGGAGNDYVDAQAQDGGGTSNANFSTPPDGQVPRMQMYLWNGNPRKDGDVDNGIIVHEFAHGISNRLAGGSAQAACLGSAEQMGEGWSDYYSLMVTQDWATSTLSDGFNKPRGIGTYVLGQAPTGSGIRSQRYCTNFAINNRTYGASIPGNGQQHSRGEIWCATLWDMTWNIINQVGDINPNIFDANAAGGNSIALRLVTEGLKLQVCNAGFIDGRNGILQADQILYNGAYRCAIMQAFARRGMGFNASQGSANSTTDQVPGFSVIEGLLTFSQSVPQQQENQLVTYNNIITAGVCGALTNYLLTDTLPQNVTYVSGGTYNASNRVVSFAVNLAAGQTQQYSFTIRINNGSWFPTATLLDERVTGSTMPPTFTTTSSNSVNFVVSPAQSHSAPNSFFAVNSSGVSNFSLVTSAPIPMGATPPTFSFWHNYNTEEGWDGGVVEISTNNGSTWQDLGPLMKENGYNGSLGTGSSNPLGGRNAFTGNSNGFIKTTISLLPYANQDALFRFTMSSDNNTPEVGWYIDDILLQAIPVVNIKSNLFSEQGALIAVKDTTTIILQNAACAPGSITQQPASKATCAGTAVSFSVGAAGTGLSYQWQQSLDVGATFSNIAGATQATYSIANPLLLQNGQQFRVQVTGTCTPAITSTMATLTVTQPINISSQPQAVSVCAGRTVSFTVQAAGPALTYQWELSTNGNNFVSLANGGDYSGANSNTLLIANAGIALNGNQYRVLVSGTACAPVASAPALLTVHPLPVVTVAPPSVVNITPYQPITLTGIASPAGNYTYVWLRDGTPVPGANAPAIIVNVDLLGTYQLSATDARGCSNVSNLVQVNDTSSTLLFIYPNPNNGVFQVRYYQAGTASSERSLQVYDAKGASIFRQRFVAVGGGYQRMDVKLSKRPASGVYFVQLRDTAGKKLAAAAIRIQ